MGMGGLALRLSFSGCNSKGPDSQYRLRGGTQALPLRLARRLKSQVLLCAGGIWPANRREVEHVA